MEIVAAILIGFVAGAVAGLMGVGGGILFVPALAIVIGLSQIEAEATSLLAIIPVSIVGSWQQHRYGNVRLREAVVIGLLSPVGVVLGVVLANTVSERLLEVSFALLVLAIAGQLVLRAYRESSSSGATTD
jgi:uncharacterized membrane protein YfcA